MKWISVKEELPDVYETILMWGIAIGNNLCQSCEDNQDSDDICNIYFGWLDEDHIFRCDFKLDEIKVSHWMEVPKGPQESNNENRDSNKAE